MPDTSLKYTVKIADFIVKIKATDQTEVFIESSYSSFLVKNEGSSVSDILISAEQLIPDYLKSNKDLIFLAKYNEQNFWSIHKQDDNYKIIVYSQTVPDQIQQIAVVDSLFKEWTIYMEPFIGEHNQVGHWPLLYPMGPLVMYYLTISNDAIMIHASGAFDGEKGRVFSGFSGVGKSTMAKIWKNNGSSIINDDRLIIRKIGGRYIMYNTPMPYRDDAKNCSLNAIYLLRHASSNSVEKLLGVKAVSGVLTNCIQQGYNRKFLEHHLKFLTELTNTISVFSIGVVPNKDIIDFIKKNEN